MRRFVYVCGALFCISVMILGTFTALSMADLKQQVERLEFMAQEQKLQQVQSRPMDNGYYLMCEDELVMVYKGDKVTLFEKTGIQIKTLPVVLQKEIREGKYMASEMELYGFLESYSS